MLLVYVRVQSRLPLIAFATTLFAASKQVDISVGGLRRLEKTEKLWDWRGLNCPSFLNLVTQTNNNNISCRIGASRVKSTYIFREKNQRYFYVIFIELFPGMTLQIS